MIDLDAIHAGLDKHAFFLEYLPIVSIDPERCVGAEALLRRQRPAGVVFPDDFGPLMDMAMPRWAEALLVRLKTTDLEVIAERMETAEQVSLLRAAGVRRARQLYFSPPLRAEAFLLYYRQHS